MRIAVAIKWVDIRPGVDPVTGAVHDDGRSAGASPADQAALEWGLRLAEAWAANARDPAATGAEVVAVTAGPVGAEAVLREALAAGATGAVRVDLDDAAPSEAVAAALAAALTLVDLVCCGDWSMDRGSGSVPAYLAAHRGAAQALGLTGLDVSGVARGELGAVRRLDRGRREHLVVPTPAVLSFEGGSARLRRAPLTGVLAARTAAIVVVRPAPFLPTGVRVERHQAYRPRARVRPAPDAASPRDRILAITGAGGDRDPPRLVRAEPEAAAAEILEQLRLWGYR